MNRDDMKAVAGSVWAWLQIGNRKWIALAVAAVLLAYIIGRAQ